MTPVCRVSRGEPAERGPAQPGQFRQRDRLRVARMYMPWPGRLRAKYIGVYVISTMPRAGRSTYRNCRRGPGCYQGAPRLSLVAFAAQGGAAARARRCRVTGPPGAVTRHRQGQQLGWGRVREFGTTAGPDRASGAVAARGVSGYSRVGRVATGVCRTVRWRALGDPRRPQPRRLSQYLGDAHLQRDHHNVNCGSITATRRATRQHLDRPRPRRHSPVPGPAGRARSPGRQGDPGQRRPARNGTIPGNRGFRFPPRGLAASGGGPNGGHRNQQLPSRHADH
jgi:hypothetical protein